MKIKKKKKLSLKPAILLNTVELSTFRVPSLYSVDSKGGYNLQLEGQVRYLKNVFRGNRTLVESFSESHRVKAVKQVTNI